MMYSAYVVPATKDSPATLAVFFEGFLDDTDAHLFLDILMQPYQHEQQSTSLH